MVIEIFFTLVIVATASFILYKNVRKKSNGGCDCGSCSANCPSRNVNQPKK